MRAIHWFRNDLRLRDNTALRDAAEAADELLLLFVLDPALLGRPDTGAPRVRFLLDCLGRLDEDATRAGSRLVLRSGEPSQVIGRLVSETGAGLVTWNRDTTPAATARDARVRAAAARSGARVLERIDRVVFESGQITRKSGGSYSVYTPYNRAWMARIAEEPKLPERAPRLPAPMPGVESDPLPEPGRAGLRRRRDRDPDGAGAPRPGGG